MINISKCLSDNLLTTIMSYMNGQGIKIIDSLTEVLNDNDSSFTDVADFLKGKIPNFTLIDLLFNIGLDVQKAGNNNLSKEIFEIVLSECGDDDKYIDYAASSNLELGKIYASRFLWKESLLKISAANEIFLREKNYQKSFYCESLCGLIFEELGGYLNARRHYINCLNLINMKTDNEKMGFVFSNLGILEFFQNNLENAISNFRRAEIYYRKVPNNNKIVEIKYNLSLLYILIKDFNNAFREIEDAIYNSEYKKHITSPENIYVNKVKLFLEKNDFSFTIPMIHNNIDIYGKHASSDLFEYIYQLKTAISGNVSSILNEVTPNYNIAQSDINPVTII